jgi:hypothetical protein
MAINFPDNPSVNDEFTSVTGRTWIWTGTTWKSKTVNLEQYILDTTDVHGISDTSLLVYQEDIADLAPKSSPTFTGTVSLPEDTTIGNVLSTEISYLDGVTSSIQTQINSVSSALDDKADIVHGHTLADITDITASASELNLLDGVLISAVEINYLSGVTSSIQTQLDDLDTLKSDVTHTHTLDDVTDVTATASEVNVLDGILSTTTELNHLSGTTSSVQDQIDGKADTSHTHTVSEVTDITASSAEINVLDGIVLSTTELNYVGGVTSSIQDQLDDKAHAIHSHTISDLTDITASASEVNLLDGVTATTTQLNYLNTTTSNVQDQINSKANLAGATFTGDLEIPNVVITGNLLVQGTTTTINTTDYAIRDNMLYMNQAGLFDVTNAVGNGTTVTYTAPSHDFQTGDYIVVTGMTPSGYNIAGTSLITIDSVSGDDFVVTKSDTGTFVSGGMARGKSAANPDLGWAAGRTTAAGYGHTGVFRDASDATFKFFDGYTPEPDESLFIDTAHASFALAPIATSAVSTGNITATGTVDLTSATVSGISLDELSDVTETSPSEGDVLYHNGSGWVNRYINAIPAKTNQATLSSSNYNIAVADAGKIIEISNSGAATVTLPSTENFAVGTQIVILQTGAGDAVVSINVQSPAVQNLNYNPGNKIRGQWAAATLLKRAADTWVLYGDLTA